MDILFLAHRVPFPPDRGDKIRAYNVLKYLSARANVHLVAFADDPRDLDTRELCASQHIISRTKSKPRAAIGALLSGRSVSEAAFAEARFQAAVDAVLAKHPIEAIYVFSGAMAQYLPAELPARTVMDFCDVDSVKFGEYARDAGFPQRWLFAREERLLARFDRAIAARVDASLFVSEAEAALFRSIGGRGDIRVVENGIDTVKFDPAASFPPVDAGDPLIVFTGQMDYAPNVEAVRWFAHDVLPRIPDAIFAIVGRAPTPEVLALENDRVIVTGEVGDVRGWLAAATVAVAPLRIARGIQNKVLEGMAMARPVVVSDAAAEGIDHGGTLRTASDAAEFAREVSALIADRAASDALGRAARRQVQARYGWDARLTGLDDLLNLTPSEDGAVGALIERAA
ncbi:TIGR03087 family PEP-CTERM/XrtA system glycosyltransferase [uncultured Sphingomonas sp.]|uniref:TIGR03087 family PEP-CTERM/XrtA system glycosyltransferase n=1 Tax=uncultured Sphingomonas sp. TaxID=158754 RepID=UPI0025E71433|nr:TIGR03087 family PEP-CTERM/XrtA system glycosyltransferase [uncultured Sphingomonas sp.]